MTRQYFGTDGIRGRVGEAPITPDFVMRLGNAAGQVLAGGSAAQVSAEILASGAAPDMKSGAAKLPRSARPAVVIGKDTRVSGYMLESALQAGLSAAGVDVYLCGPMPTPAVAYLARALRLSAGIVISASHNPYDDNGFKFFSRDGSKLPDAVELEIERMLAQPLLTVDSARLGRARRIADAPGRYIEFCKGTFPADGDLRGLRIVVDSAHGAAYHVAGPVLHELGADVIAIGNQPDGFNINRSFGATHPSTLRDAVSANQAHLGIALDGDGDRLLMCDDRGRVYDGDQLLYAIAIDRLDQGLLRGGVAGTLMSNLALERALAAREIAFERAKVGDRYVLELLLARGWQLGGENSGHILCLDRHTTGDGIVSALQVLAALTRTGRTLGETAGALELYPQVMINVRLADLNAHRDNAMVAKTVDGARKALGAGGRVLLRPSGTEPVVRVMVESEREATSREWAESIAAAVRAAA
ncbi:MAG: phosphoglucosamine mutase [Proteobacteria bacterium]|nr:phosphoglucosamine mutase [Burkholderiales bacterium]